MTIKMFVTSKSRLAFLLAIFIVAVFIFLIVLHLADKSNSCVTRNRFYGFKFYFMFPFKENMQVPAENDGADCKYAFYEGIYKSSNIVSNSSVNLAKVCNYINKSFPPKSWDQCFFRVGTASTYFLDDKVVYDTKLSKEVDEKLENCKKYSGKTLDCVIGVYTGVNLLYQSTYQDGKLVTRGDDPFWLCKIGRGQEFKLACYRNMVSFLYHYTGGDMQKAVALIESSLVDDFERFEILLTYFSSFAYIPSFSYQDIQKLCTSFKEGLIRYSCMVGYATGIDEVAKTNEEGAEVAKYCLSPLFSFKEKGECIKRGFYELPTTNDLEIKKAECLKTIPSIYKKYCNVGDDILVPGYLR